MRFENLSTKSLPTTYLYFSPRHPIMSWTIEIKMAAVYCKFLLIFHSLISIQIARISPTITILVTLTKTNKQINKYINKYTRSNATLQATGDVIPISLPDSSLDSEIFTVTFISTKPSTGLRIVLLSWPQYIKAMNYQNWPRKLISREVNIAACFS